MNKQIIKNTNLIKGQSDSILEDISNFIEQAKEKVAREYNSTHLLLCWMIGKRIEEEILQSDKAEYGEQIIANLSNNLSIKYGKGYSVANLFRMIKFFKLFPN